MAPSFSPYMMHTAARSSSWRYVIMEDLPLTLILVA